MTTTNITKEYVFPNSVLLTKHFTEEQAITETKVNETNDHPCTIPMHSVAGSTDFQNTDMKLPMALGMGVDCIFLKN